MGIYTDLATGSVAISQTKPRVGLDRSSAEQLLQKAAQHDPPSAAAWAATDDVQRIPEQTTAATGDTFTLTFNFPNLAVGTFTTAAIAFDATDATIESAIDTAATTASVTGWTNGDITVLDENAAGLDDGWVDFTCDGASVTGQPADLIVMTPTGWTQDGTITKTASGQVDRKATEALRELNAVSGVYHDSVDAPVWTKPAANGQSRPRKDLLRSLCAQAEVEDGNENVWDAVIALYPEVAKA